MKALALALFAFLVASSASAVRAPAATPAPGTTPAAAAAEPSAAAPTPAPLEFKNKSSFVVDNTRNPFWPIGWKPAARTSEATTNEHSGPEIASSAFLVTSITLGHTNRFAIVNGKVMQEGQQFGLQMGSQTYQITVKAIQDGRVIFARRDQEIIAPLRRK
jgi:curli biogenesis system outer membrane secretion channel CsgG